MAPDGKGPPLGAARKSDKSAKRAAGFRGEGRSSSSSSSSSRDAATVSTPTAPRSSPAGVIDLSSPSWDDDPFLEAAEHPHDAAEPSGSRRNLKSNKMTTTTTTGSGGGSTAGRRRPAAPLTSISALFGAGGGGNRANRPGSTTAPPSKPRAGTKRPRPPTAATGQSRVKLPPPPPASASAARGGRENMRQNHHPFLHPLGVGGLGAREATAGNRDGSVARGRGGVEDQLWPDKHRPRDISCLAVHSKKVDEVRHWMTLALAARPENEEACRVLALVGPPGSAKSTMVRLLAQDMDVELAEWQDTSGQGGPAYRPFADGPALSGERPRYELGSSYESSIDSFEEFMKRSSYRALSVLAVKASKAGAGTGSRAGASDGSGSGGASAGGGGGGKRQRVVLIEDLPEVYGEEKKTRLRSLMAECARSSPSPVIICWSQASESASYQSRLEQVLSRETLRMPGVQITTCNPINATLLRQHLKGVLALEGVSDPKGTLVQSAITICAGDIRHALLNLQMSVGGRGGSGSTAAATAAAAAAGRSNGGRGRAKRSGAAADAAAAAAGVGGRKKRGAGVSKSCAAGATAGGTGQRDTFLTQFHALGKLLYAKRAPPDSDGAGGWPTTGAGGGRGDGGGEGRPPLAFVPEEVLSQGGMELDWALAFLQYHCVDFYTDESELSQGLGYFSDADVFASRMFDSSRGYDGGGEQGVFPQRYAESIASRATAASNRHPAKSRMRAFGAPKSFEMRRSRKEASGALRRFVGDAWDASGGDADALWASSRHLKEAVDTDLLPTARLITGEWEAEVALRSLLQRFMQDREQQQEGQQLHRTWPTGADCGAAAAMHTDGGRLSLPAGGAAPASPPPSSWAKGAAAGGRGERRAANGGEMKSGGGVGGHGSTAAVSDGEGGGAEEEDLDEIGDF